MFFLCKVYIKKKKTIPPSKISTKLKEMEIGYNLIRAQHRQKIHTHYLVLHVGFPFTLLRQWFPQVSSEIRGMVHGSFCNSDLFSGNISLYSLKWVLFFWFRTPEAEAELGPLGLLAQDWLIADTLSQVPAPLGATVHLLVLSGFSTQRSSGL